MHKQRPIRIFSRAVERMNMRALETKCLSVLFSKVKAQYFTKHRDKCAILITSVTSDVITRNDPLMTSFSPGETHFSSGPCHKTHEPRATVHRLYTSGRTKIQYKTMIQAGSSSRPCAHTRTQLNNIGTHVALGRGHAGEEIQRWSHMKRSIDSTSRLTQKTLTGASHTKTEPTACSGIISGCKTPRSIGPTKMSI